MTPADLRNKKVLIFNLVSQHPFKLFGRFFVTILGILLDTTKKFREI